MGSRVPPDAESASPASTTPAGPISAGPGQEAAGCPVLRPEDREILRLALPAFGALVAEPLFLLTDSAIVGRIGTVPLAGLGVASQALTTLVSISIFLAYGTTAAVARQVGAGRRLQAIRQGIDGIWLAAAIGVVVLAVGWPLAPEIVRVFGASSAVSSGAVTYLRISLFGAPSMLVILAGTGVLRGLQDTRTPLAVSVAASTVNIALNATLVLGLHFGLAGSASGTVMAQSAGAGAYLAMIARGARRAGVGLGFDRAGLSAAATAAVGLIVRTLALQVVLVVTTAVAARQGDAAIAAHQVAFRIWMLLALALDAIAIAGQAITGRCLGAGDVAGARAATGRMIGWGAVYGAGFCLILLLARPLLPGLFAVTPAVRGLLLAVLVVAALQQPVAGVVFVLDGVLIGAGAQRYLAARRARRPRPARRPGGAVARLQPVAAGQVRHSGAARPREPLAGNRRCALILGGINAGS